MQAPNETAVEEHTQHAPTRAALDGWNRCVMNDQEWRGAPHPSGWAPGSPGMPLLQLQPPRGGGSLSNTNLAGQMYCLVLSCLVLSCLVLSCLVFASARLAGQVHSLVLSCQLGWVDRCAREQDKGVLSCLDC